MSMFKMPEETPQDLLLIQEIIGDIENVNSRTTTSSVTDRNDPIDSSDSECDSQDEIEAHLLVKTEGDVPSMSASSATGRSTPDPNPDSSTDTDTDTDTDYDDGAPTKGSGPIQREPTEQFADDEEEYSGAVADVHTYHRTKSEISSVNIKIPDIGEVESEERLEKVGEILSIVDDVVVVSGMATENPSRASEKALDSETLLVFEDRKVMGYVYETFGPTTQPFYQVRFNESYPLDPTKIWVSREVFHIPQRSRFIFLKQIWSVKGSDASNMNDEEPEEEELEFSDDEKEAEHKKRKKMRGMNRASSSRLSTPIPSQIRDQDLNDENPYLDPKRNPYDEHGPYDMDFTASVTRPPPMPYDDPYSDAYGTEVTKPDVGRASNGTDGPGEGPLPSLRERNPGRGRGRGKASQWNGQPSLRGYSGRGRGRGRGRRDRSASFPGHDVGDGDFYDHPSNSHQTSAGPHDRQPSRQLSPTSFAIARATGQLPDESMPGAHTSMGSIWEMQQQQQQTFAHPHQQPSLAGIDPQGFQFQYVQPHINPRFASALGFNIGNIPVPQPYAQFGPGSTQPGQEWSGHWPYREAEDAS